MANDVFQVYNAIRKQWKIIEVDEVPDFFAKKLKRIYAHPLQSAQDARDISERLRTRVPFLGFNTYEDYSLSDTDEMVEHQRAFWEFVQTKRTMSELIRQRHIDCNVLSLAIQQVIPDTQVYFKATYTDTKANTRTTRHTFTVHPRDGYYLCVDLVNSRRAHDSFFKQETLLGSYTRVELKPPST